MKNSRDLQMSENTAKSNFIDSRDLPQEQFVFDVRIVLKRLMATKGMTQVELARRTGISPAAISRMLAGKQEMTIRQLAAIAHVLGFEVRVG